MAGIDALPFVVAWAALVIVVYAVVLVAMALAVLWRAARREPLLMGAAALAVVLWLRH